MQEKFLHDLGSALVSSSATNERPLDIQLSSPSPLSLTVYLFPNTNPHGGRQSDEYKFNLTVPGQTRGVKANFDTNMGIPLLVSYTKEFDVYIIYDADRHKNFVWNANVQSKLDFITDACINGISICVRQRGEKLIAVTSRFLIKGITEWLKYKAI